jgi:asparagine N-glycosylation enzyme membrane subunit Stt3
VEIKHPGAPTFTFVQTGMTDTDGRFVLRVPYATDGMPFQLVARTPWRVVVNGVTRDVRVSEQAVQDGTDVTIP